MSLHAILSFPDLFEHLVELSSDHFRELSQLHSISRSCALCPEALLYSPIGNEILGVSCFRQLFETERNPSDPIFNLVPIHSEQFPNPPPSSCAYPVNES